MCSTTTVLRFFTVLLMGIGTVFALILCAIGGMGIVYAAVPFSAWWMLLSVTGLAVVLIVSIACWRALLRFYAMCGRLKTQSAFTEINCTALGFIARQCALAGTVMLGSFLIFILAFVLNDAADLAAFILIRLTVLPLLLLVAGLMIHAVHLLMRRALALQQESDLTV